jgi:hypothetical protein
VTAVLPLRLRTVDEPRFVPAPRVYQPSCPRCGTPLQGLLDECTTPACVTAANDFEARYERHWED